MGLSVNPLMILKGRLCLYITAPSSQFLGLQFAATFPFLHIYLGMSPSLKMAVTNHAKDEGNSNTTGHCDPSPLLQSHYENWHHSGTSMVSAIQKKLALWFEKPAGVGRDRLTLPSCFFYRVVVPTKITILHNTSCFNIPLLPVSNRALFISL